MPDTLSRTVPGTVPNTFAKHVLSRAAAGVEKSRKSPAAGSESSASQRTSKSGTTTYASVVLMLAMGSHAPSAAAATDGSLGQSSSGKVGISLTIPERIEARGLREFSAGSATGCVFGRGAKNYRVSVPEGEPYVISFVADEAGCTEGEDNARLTLARASGGNSFSVDAAESARPLTLLISPE